MTRKPIAEDFEAIAKGLRKLQKEKETIPSSPNPTKILEICVVCEGGGWKLSSYQANGSPRFEECDECWNPLGLPCP